MLTFLYECETGSINENINCSKDALEIAIKFMRNNLTHSYKAYELLPHISRSLLSVNQERLYFELPDEFTRVEAKSKSQDLGIAERTMDEYLKVFKNKELVEKMNKEKYKKKEPLQ